jgi:hypothetical protein
VRLLLMLLFGPTIRSLAHFSDETYQRHGRLIRFVYVWIPLLLWPAITVLLGFLAFHFLSISGALVRPSNLNTTCLLNAVFPITFAVALPISFGAVAICVNVVYRMTRLLRRGFRCP